MKRTLIGIVIGILLGVGGTVLAANKTFTYSGPGNYMAGGWSVTLTANSEGGVATSWSARTYACAWDNVNSAPGDCYENVETTSNPPVVITNFVDQRLAAWRAARGY